MARDNFNFPAFKATEYMYSTVDYKMCKKLFGENTKIQYCPRMKENSFLSIFIQKLPGEGGMPPDPPKGSGPYCTWPTWPNTQVYFNVKAETNTAMAASNSI